MENLSALLSIAKQLAAKLIGLKSNDKAAKTQTLPFTNGIAVLKSNEQQQNLIDPTKTPASVEKGICSLQISLENMPKLVLYKLPSRLPNAKDPLGRPSVSPLLLIEQTVDKDLHTSLATMWERLKTHYKFTAHHTQTMFLRQLKATKWRKRSDLIIDFQISMGKSMVGNDESGHNQHTVKVDFALDIAETFQLLHVAPPTDKNSVLSVRHLDQAPIVASTFTLTLINVFIALCYLLQWPAYICSIAWTLQQSKESDDDKWPCSVVFVIFFVWPGSIVSIFAFFCAFLEVNDFVKKLSSVCPQQTIRIQTFRLLSAISVLSLQCVYPMLQRHSGMNSPLFIHLFPEFIPNVAIGIAFLTCALLLYILPCATECHIFFGYVDKNNKKLKANKAAICAERKLAEGIWKTMDANGYSQATFIKEFFKS